MSAGWRALSLPAASRGREREPGKLPHRAMRAVAADEIRGADVLLVTVPVAQHAIYGAIFDREARELDTALDCDPRAREVLAEDPLRLRLGDEQDEWKPCVGRTDRAERGLGDLASAEVKHEPGAR